MWVNFARTGNPSIDGTDWPEFRADKLSLYIDTEKKGGCRVVKDYFGKNYKMVEPLLDYDFINAGL